MRRQSGKTRTTLYLATEAYGLQAEQAEGLQPPSYVPNEKPALSRVSV